MSDTIRPRIKEPKAVMIQRLYMKRRSISESQAAEELTLLHRPGLLGDAEKWCRAILDEVLVEVAAAYQHLAGEQRVAA